jgi:2-C-methyl-D-erythritol 4-phosphate cytidylyltransferase|tara:strand:+ start:239 stop:1036 length:798 start_codon:yes stop_codon:yes gene_type:complete
VYDADMKIAVIIPAAGKSTRYGEKDKLAEDLGGRPLLIRTVEFFTKREEITQIIVVGPSQSFDSFKERFGPALSFHGVLIVKGGDTRCDSVKQGIAVVEDEIDRIAVHDGARPALSNTLFETILLAAKELDAVAAATPISGTVKRTKTAKKTIGDEDDIADAIFGGAGKATVDAFEVEQTLDRTGLWELQTPQIFESTLLKRAYNQIEGIQATDDAQLVEELGEVVHLVQGESRNIKVTTKSDLFMVKAMLGVKAPSERAPHKRF